MLQANFWRRLKKPILALAPMANVTDTVFRQMFIRCGRPSVLFTEFVSADGLIHPVARRRLLLDLKFSLREKPIVAQFFTASPDNIFRAARLARRLGFSGVDINMGCPDRNVERQGGGAALIKNPSLAAALIEAARRGAGGLPVSVKTRLGYQSVETEDWIGFLLRQKPDLLAVHLRTRKEMSVVPAHWEEAKKIIALRNRISPVTLILGNGDIKSRAEANRLARRFNLDGIMVGRGAFGNPWFFSSRKTPIRLEEKLEELRRHLLLFKKTFGRKKKFFIMRKHISAYLSGYPHIRLERSRLLASESFSEALAILKDCRQNIRKHVS